ncbi:hypothetical protein [Hymenobacter metallicola]|nr:hypothetical protein [Hymenobacter metallicola]
MPVTCPAQAARLRNQLRLARITLIAAQLRVATANAQLIAQ